MLCKLNISVGTEQRQYKAALLFYRSDGEHANVQRQVLVDDARQCETLFLVLVHVIVFAL